MLAVQGASRILASLVLLSPAFGSLACGGSSGGQNGDGQDGAGGNGPQAGQNGKPGVTPDEVCADVELLPRRAVRLTAPQYKNALQRAFDVELADNALPEDPLSSDGVVSFSTYASGLTVTASEFATFQDASRTVADKVVASLAQDGDHKCLLGAADKACVTDVVRQMGEKAFRRRMTDDEVNRFSSFFEQQRGDFGAQAAAKLLVRALVLSPSHLYRTEFGGADESKDDTVTLANDEIANLLAFTLTDDAPDEDLVTAARAGKLRDGAARRREAERLLDTPGAARKLADLFQQLYRLSEVLTAPKDPQAFATLTPELRSDMSRELADLVSWALTDGGGLEGLFSTRSSHMTGRLARFYGLSTDAGDDERVRLQMSEARRGLLSMGGLLLATSPADHTSPSQRGLFVLTSLLCETIPQPPEGAQDQANGKIFDPNGKTFTQREHWDYAVRTAPECTGCHSTFVPYGLGLEHFDPIGRDRSEEHGKRIDPTLVIEGLDADVDGRFVDTAAFAETLIQSPRGAGCFVRHARGFLLGEPPGEASSCRNRTFGQQFLNDGLDVRALVLDLVSSPAFVTRRAGT